MLLVRPTAYMMGNKFVLPIFSVVMFAISPVVLASSPAEYSDFIRGEVKLGKCFKRPDSFCYVKPGSQFRKFNRIAFTPIEFRLHPDSEYRGVAPANFKLLSDMFHRTLIGQLEPEYQVVISTNPSTVAVRVALTGIKLLKTNVANTSDTSMRAALDNLSKTINLSDATLESEFIDGETGERISVQVDRNLNSNNVNNESLKELKKIYKKVISVIHEEYALKDPVFVFNMNRERESKRITKIAEKEYYKYLHSKEKEHSE